MVATPYKRVKGTPAEVVAEATPKTATKAEGSPKKKAKETKASAKKEPEKKVPRVPGPKAALVKIVDADSNKTTHYVVDYVGAKATTRKVYTNRRPNSQATQARWELTSNATTIKEADFEVVAEFQFDTSKADNNVIPQHLRKQHPDIAILHPAKKEKGAAKKKKDAAKEKKDAVKQKEEKAK